jgi:hypothetical protein
MKLRPGRLSFFLVLAFSLALNVALVVRATVSGGGVPAHLRPAAQGESLLPLLVPAEARWGSRESLHGEACRLAENELGARISALKNQMEKHETPKERFEHADPVRRPELENELRKRLGSGDSGYPLSLEVECRRNVCRVQLAGDAQSTPHIDLEWARRNVRGVMTAGTDTYYGIRDVDVPSGFDILMRLVDDLRRSGDVEHCAARYDDKGSLDVRLNLAMDEDDFEDAPSGLSLRVTGPLVGTPLGDCIVAQLRRARDAIDLPASYQPAALHLSLPEKQSDLR